ncbi:response regulator [Pseudonocardia humida]|uniref:Response regulator transcription factor n=1 Tax=Pseudonocardia humida TaxID=2800819 RepID=A0ABT1A4B8_9PSEU|nr:response regulator transcription factor [Pseudonocardia humida]MCO1657856.1 response regulator transcription factor [Pseudonocardia humida]
MLEPVPSWADVVLCDDHPVFTDALGAVLTHHGLRVRAVAHRAADVVGVVVAHRPQVCVVDRHFADGDGLAELPRVRAASPATRVVLLTADRDPDTARRALAAGAAGYLCKTAGVSALVSTITRVAQGEVVTGAVPAPLSPVRAAEHVEAHRLAGYLTPRERDCLAMMVDGLGTAAIAARLGVSAATARTYAQAVLTKLGVHSRLEAAAFAVRHALLDPSA